MTRLIGSPKVDWDEATLSPNVRVALDRMEGRRTETLRHGTSWWTGYWRSVQLSAEELAFIDAWMMEATDDAVFRAHDVTRPRPLAEDTGQPLSGTRAGGGAFDGTGGVSAIQASRRGATITGLPAGFQLLPGDYVEFAMSTALVSLHIITAGATANGAGVATVSFRQALDATFTTAATANLEAPSCLMQIDTGSYAAPRSGMERVASFSATEVFPLEVVA